MSDKNHIENIQNIIDDLAQSNSFSAGAMAQFTAMKDELDSAERTIKYLRGNNKEKDEEIKQLKQDNRAANEEITRMYGLEQEWHKRNSELCDRENQATELALRSEMNEQRVKDHQLMFSTVFKGYHMRRQVVSPPTQGFVDQNNMTQYGDPAQKHDVEDQE